jgi:hypothetical protein
MSSLRHGQGLSKLQRQRLERRSWTTFASSIEAHLSFVIASPSPQRGRSIRSCRVGRHRGMKMPLKSVRPEAVEGHGLLATGLDRRLFFRPIFDVS